MLSISVLFPTKLRQVKMCHYLCVFQHFLLGLAFSNTKQLIRDAFLTYYLGMRPFSGYIDRKPKLLAKILSKCWLLHNMVEKGRNQKYLNGTCGIFLS